MKITHLFVTLSLLALANFAHATDFKKDVFPILSRKCAECHSVGKKTKGDFAIDRKEDMEKQFKAGESAKSSIVITVQLPDDDEDVMPPKGKNRFTPAEVATLKAWIDEGGSFDASSAPPAAPAAAPAAGGVVAWTNNAGKTLQASFQGMDGADRVLLKAEDGTVYTYPMANLSPESQEQAKKMAGGQ
jgi:hypothetical protein